MMDNNKQDDAHGKRDESGAAGQAGEPGSRSPRPGKLEPETTGFLASRPRNEPKSWTPWIVATIVIILVIVALVVFTRGAGPRSESASGTEQAAPYAANLPISQLVMSGATSFAGMQVTYLDGQIANTGKETITGITVQVDFRNDQGQYTKRTVMPLTLIRTRQPYIDIESVAASPLKPGDHKGFRLIFDKVPADWNEQMPQIRIVRTETLK